MSTDDGMRAAIEALPVGTVVRLGHTFPETGDFQGHKASSRQRATELWPSEAARFARVKDDGRAEACLIAEYGRRCQIGGGA